jgi:Flp pilus assembly protein TadB
MLHNVPVSLNTANSVGAISSYTVLILCVSNIWNIVNFVLRQICKRKRERKKEREKGRKEERKEERKRERKRERKKGREKGRKKERKEERKRERKGSMRKINSGGEDISQQLLLITHCQFSGTGHVAFYFYFLCFGF